MREKLTASVAVETDHEYHAFEKLVAVRVALASGPLFTTDAEGLFDTYLAGISEEHRQHYQCAACRHFIERYGGLVRLDLVEAENIARAVPHTVCWTPMAPAFFMASASALHRKVLSAKVTGVFLCSEKVWGTPVTGPWTHLSGVPASVFKHPTLSAAQVMAEKREDYAMLSRGLSEVPMEAVVQAVRVLEADAVDRSEKTLGVAKWLLELHQRIAGIKGPARHNLVWLAVATAPAGWCHVRSTMISTLLDDIVTGLPFDSIARRWAEKIHPLQYQRPTAPVKAGVIKQANELVERLGAAGALQRRFARLSDVASLWMPSAVPAAEKPKDGGAFDHLLPTKGRIKEVELPATKISWDKFRATVLPVALKAECLVPHGPAGFYGLVTAANPDAPAILQWDGLDGCARNPVSWYFYHGGSTATNWGLEGGLWTEVRAIFLKPCYWQRPEKFQHQGSGVLFALAGARDLRHSSGGGFFPECLRSEYHGIRSAMEAYAQSAAIAGRDEGDANGIALDEKNTLRVRIRTAQVASMEYVLTLG